LEIFARDGRASSRVSLRSAIDAFDDPQVALRYIPQSGECLRGRTRPAASQSPSHRRVSRAGNGAKQVQKRQIDAISKAMRPLGQV